MNTKMKRIFLFLEFGLFIVCSTQSIRISSLVDSMILACNNSQCMCCTGATDCLCRDNIEEVLRCGTDVRCHSGALCTLIPLNKSDTLQLRFQCGCYSNQCNEIRLQTLKNSTTSGPEKTFCQGGVSFRDNSTVRCSYTFDQEFNTSYSANVTETNSRWGIWTRFLHRSRPNILRIKPNVVRYQLEVGEMGRFLPDELVMIFVTIPDRIVNNHQTAFIGNPQPFIGNCSSLSCFANEVCLNEVGKCGCTNPDTTQTTSTIVTTQSPVTSKSITVAVTSESSHTMSPTEIQEVPPPDDLQYISCQVGVELNDGECYHSFDQTFVWNESYKNLNDKELFKELETSIVTSWKSVYDFINEQISFLDGHVLRSHQVVRYKIRVAGVNWTSRELVNIYKNNNTVSDLGKLLAGYPQIYTDVCPVVQLSCGLNSKCVSILATPVCACLDGFHGDPLVECSAFCSPTTYKNFTFPRQWNGLSSFSMDICNAGFSRAFLPCQLAKNGKAVFQFEKLVTINCSQTVSGVISKATTETLSPNQIEEWSADLLLLTSNSSTISYNDVENVSNFVQIVSDGVTGGKTNISVDGFLAIAILASQISSSSSFHDNQHVGNTLTRSLSALSVRLDIGKNKSSIDVETEAVLLHVMGGNDLSSGEGIIFQPTFRSFDGKNFTQPLRVRIPAKVADEAWGIIRNKRDLNEIERSKIVSFIFYKDDTFFQAGVGAAYVASVDVGVDQILQNLDESISIDHLGVSAKFQTTQVQGNRFKALRTSLSCKYWDYHESGWRSDGCCLNSTSSTPQCLCNHLTNFALIVKSEIVPHDVALSIVSIVGLVISVFGMIATAIVIASAAELRKHRSGKILIQICVNLSVSHIIFLTCVSRVKAEGSCIVVAAFLQYFFLVSWGWMSVYSYDMYISLVKVFSKYRSKFLLKATVVCYGIPLVIVAINLGLTVGYFDQIHDDVFCDGSFPLRRSFYLSDNICWLGGYSLYVGFLTPVALFLLYNCFVFVVVTIELNKHNKESQSEALRRTTRQSLLLASTMVAVLGITWLFAYLMLISDDEIYHTVTSWIFTVFCSLQGLGIFVLTTVRREDMRKVWFDPLTKCCNCGNSPETPPTARKSTGTSRVVTSSNHVDQGRSSTG